MGTQVAVIMPVHNAERFLRESVESVLNQTFRDFVLLACDDGSSDNSLSILEEYARQDERLHIMKNGKNLGITETCNKLLAAIPPECKFFARMDSDDVCMPDRLERQLKFLESHGDNICAVGSSLEIIDEQSRVTGFRPYPTEPEDIRRIMPNRNVVAHPSLMFRRSAFEAAGGYKAQCCKGYDCCRDYECWLRMLEKFDFANLPDPVLKYRMSQTQIKQKKLRASLKATLAIQTAYRNRTHTWTLPARLHILAEYMLLCLPSAVVLKLFEFMTYRKKSS